MELIDKQKEVKNTGEKTTATANKKRKFRAMTIGEYCSNLNYCKKCEYRHGIFCDYSKFQGVDREREKGKSYKTKDGKYIFVEVKE